MHLEVYRQRPDVQAVVHAHPPTATGLRRRRHPARPRRARRGADDARQHSDRRVRDAVDHGAARGGAPVHQGARRHAARQPRRADASAPTSSPRTTRWRRSSTSRRSASSRGCSGARTCCRGEEVDRLQELRGTYGIKAPAPICADRRRRARRRRRQADASCQMVVRRPTAAAARARAGGDPPAPRRRMGEDGKFG